MSAQITASHRLLPAAVAASGVFLLAGCAGGQDAQDTASASGAASSSAQAQDGDLLRVEQPWLKAADSGMTAAFGQLHNDGDTAVTLTGASADGIAGVVELHETVADPQTGATRMQALEDPIVIEPGETVELVPGGNHIMLMDLQCAPMAGTELSVQLQFEDGQKQTLELPVRDYTGAQEEYAPGEEPSAGEVVEESETAMDSMDGMDQGEMDSMEDPSAQGLPMCEEAA